MNDSKKNIIAISKIIVFIILFIIVFIVLTYIMKPINVNLKNITGFYGEPENSLDMVYIGGSAAFVYWQPLKAYEDSGIVSYNFAINSVQAENYIYMIKEILKTQNPNLIVLDARAFQYRDDEERGPDSVRYYNFTTGLPFSKNRYEYIENNVPKYLGEDTLAFHFDLIKYHTNRDELDIKTSLKMMLGTYKNEYKGAAIYQRVAPIKKQDLKTNNRTSLSLETEKILIELLEYIKTIDCEFLFVVSPYSMPKEDIEKFNYIEEKIENNGFKFLDVNEYYDEMQLDFNTNFYDMNHVNIFGAEKYTNFLESYIKKNYNLPDRREDTNYDSWDKLLKNWHKQIDKTKDKINKMIEEKDWYGA